MAIDFRLTGKRVLVTGAGRGLGRCIADTLVDLGATVFGTSRDRKTSLEIADRYGTPDLHLEMKDARSIASFARHLQSLSGGVDMLVNNAGINIAKPALELTEDDWDDVLDTNLKGSFLLSTSIARSWIELGVPGVIVNVASQAGLVGIEERAAYGSSKAGLIHLTKVLALEWAQHGIRVNAVAPTFVRTELTQATLSRPEWAAELLSRIPSGRFGEPEDVAGGVAFLFSDAASMITGHTLTIDGGYTIR